LLQKKYTIFCGIYEKSIDSLLNVYKQLYGDDTTKSIYDEYNSLNCTYSGYIGYEQLLWYLNNFKELIDYWNSIYTPQNYSISYSYIMNYKSDNLILIEKESCISRLLRYERSAFFSAVETP